MLVALNYKKQPIILSKKIDLAHLRKLRQQQFFCPQCFKPVILKAGTIKIPHFAHKQKSNCDQLFSEGETINHINGKLQLFEWLQSKRVRVELESPITSLNQRPDLLAKIQKTQYAIEYQCSPISRDMFIKRTTGYQKQNIYPIWIPKQYESNKRQMSYQHIFLNSFYKLFLNRSSRVEYICCYDSEKKKFCYYHSPMYIQKNQYIVAVETIPLDFQRLPLLQPSPIKKSLFLNMLMLYRKKQSELIKTKFYYGQAKVQDLLWRSLYELRLNYMNLPIFVGVPIRGSDQISDSTLEWQIALHFFSQLHGLKVYELTDKDIYNYCKWGDFDSELQQTMLVIKRYIQILKQGQIDTVHSIVEQEKFIKLLYEQFVAF